jgi:hypothetical protein
MPAMRSTAGTSGPCSGPLIWPLSRPVLATLAIYDGLMNSLGGVIAR